jgi:hypothetical protein
LTFVEWCTNNDLRLMEVRRADLERLDAHLNGSYLTGEDAHEQSASRSAFYPEWFGDAAR